MMAEFGRYLLTTARAPQVPELLVGCFGVGGGGGGGGGFGGPGFGHDLSLLVGLQSSFALLLDCSVHIPSRGPETRLRGSKSFFCQDHDFLRDGGLRPSA